MKKSTLLTTMIPFFYLSCMYSPYDGESINTRVTKREFSGLLNYASRTVHLEIYNFQTQSWKRFASTQSASTPTTHQGQNWYPWSITTHLPRTGEFWPSNEMGLGKIRAVSNNSALYTGTLNHWMCVQNASQYMPYTDAYDFCGDPLQEVAVLGDCDVVVSNALIGAGCYDSFSVLNEADWPENKDPGYASTLQGITHNDTHWFMTSTEHFGSLVRYSKSEDLEASPTSMIVKDLFKPGWYHPGDIDYSNGWLYVALERTAGDNTGNAISNAIGAIPVNSYANKSTYIKFLINEGPQVNGGVMPWIARDPGTDFFYSSLFENTNKLQRYKASFDSNGKPTGFQYCGEVQLNENLHRVQGGAFSDSGRLYVTMDARSSSESIVKVIEMKGHTTGKEPLLCPNPVGTNASVIKKFNINKNYGGLCAGESCAYYEEVEGITIWDLKSNDTPSTKAEGQIHIILVNKRFPGDKFWLKHLKINPIENL